MSVDLLQDVEAIPSEVRSLEGLEDLAREAVRHAAQVGLAIQGMKGSAATFENAWQRIVVDVAKGNTAEIQAARPRLVDAFERRLNLLKQTHALATWLRKLGSGEVSDPDILLPEIAKMEQIKSHVLDRWHTVDDLEDLAARDYPLTTTDLDQIGPARRPAASWYSEESKPF